MLRSILRVLLATAGTALVLAAVAFLAVSQPFVGPARLGAEPQPVADPSRLRRDVEELATTFSPRDVDHPERLAAAAEYLASQLHRAGLVPERQRFAAHGMELENVVAALGTPGRPLVVVGAHYDSFGDAGPNPGADDNASGVAGILELARLLARRDLPIELELVAFTTEEPPYFASQWMGSRVYAERLHRSGRRPVAMLSLEMIGYFSERQPWPGPLLRLLYPNRGDFVMLVGRHSERPLTRWLLASFAARGTLRARSWVGPDIGGLDGSDHRSFWAQGIPAVMVTDTAFLRNPHYHTAEDRPETLSYEQMARVVEGLASALQVGPPQ